MDSVRQKNVCPTDLQEQIATLIYAAPRCECEELVKLKQLLLPRVGKEFVQSASDNDHGEVNPRVHFPPVYILEKRVSFLTG